jgi:hypothetical protein
VRAAADPASLTLVDGVRLGLVLALLSVPALAQEMRPAFITGGALMTVAPQAAPPPAKQAEGTSLRRDFEAFMQTQAGAPAPQPARSIDEVQLEPFKAMVILRQLEAETSPYTHEGLERLKSLRQAIVELEAVHRGMLELARQAAKP